MSIAGWQPVFEGDAHLAIRATSPPDTRPLRGGSKGYWAAPLREALGTELDVETYSDRPPTARVKGQPIWLSFSSTEGCRACIWSKTRPVGIDLERDRAFPDATRMLRIASNDSEIARVRAAMGDADEAGVLLRIWTAKEAALKVLGTGLGIPPRSVDLVRVTADDCCAVAGDQGIPVRWRAHPGCYVAIALGP